MRDGGLAGLMRGQAVIARVDESFALAERENEDLEGWRRGHQGYFEAKSGFDWEMMLVCERFKVIHDYEA